MSSVYCSPSSPRSHTLVYQHQFRSNKSHLRVSPNYSQRQQHQFSPNAFQTIETAYPPPPVSVSPCSPTVMTPSSCSPQRFLSPSRSISPSRTNAEISESRGIRKSEVEQQRINFEVEIKKLSKQLNYYKDKYEQKAIVADEIVRENINLKKEIVVLKQQLNDMENLYLSSKSDNRYSIGTIGRLKKSLHTANEECNSMQIMTEEMKNHCSLITEEVELERVKMIDRISHYEKLLSEYRKKLSVVENQRVSLIEKIEKYELEESKHKELQLHFLEAMKVLEASKSTIIDKGVEIDLLQKKYASLHVDYESNLARHGTSQRREEHLIHDINTLLGVLLIEGIMVPKLLSEF